VNIYKLSVIDAPPVLLLRVDRARREDLRAEGIYFHYLTSYWSHAGNILTICPPIGRTQGIFSLFDLLLVARREYSHYLSSYWPQSWYILSISDSIIVAKCPVCWLSKCEPLHRGSGDGYIFDLLGGLDI
jgi:hypothetical protein